jgi:hypothetical protein
MNMKKTHFDLALQLGLASVQIRVLPFAPLEGGEGDTGCLTLEKSTGDSGTLFVWLPSATRFED